MVRSWVGPLILAADEALLALAPVAVLVLAAVFAAAAVTKAADRATTADEFAGLGLPAPRLLARAVPPAEIAVALVLVWRPAAGAGLAALALLAFSAVLAAALRSGRAVSCGCLGSLSRRPITPLTLVRNGALLAVAALASTAPAAGGLRPTLPDPELVVSLTLAAMLAAVGGQLLLLRAQIGRIWSVELAGEAATRGGRRLTNPTRNRIDDLEGSES